MKLQYDISERMYGTHITLSASTTALN